MNQYPNDSKALQDTDLIAHKVYQVNVLETARAKRLGVIKIKIIKPVQIFEFFN